MKKYEKLRKNTKENDKIWNILKVKYRGKYGKINRIWKILSILMVEYKGEREKKDKILIILKQKYRKNRF